MFATGLSLALEPKLQRTESKRQRTARTPFMKQWTRTQSDSSPFLQRLSSFSNQVTVFLRVLFFSFSRSYFCFHCSAVSSTFTVTVFLMVFWGWYSSYWPTNLCPNMRVDLVSHSL
uniref:Uncharacterized protein n=1 Tax=Cyclopterus lumpus TaxID=8103 RepID=A0A8C3A6B1_CYCLU